MTKRIRNEISIGGKLQPVVEDVNTKYAGRSGTMEEILNYFTEISYHLPAIYNVVMNDRGYNSDIIFQSHRTKKFYFRIVNGDYADLAGISLIINRLDTYHHDDAYICVSGINKDPRSLRMAIKYLKAIMKNPTVAMYLSDKYPYKKDLLLDDKYFTEEGIKTATEYCNRYYHFKRIRQQFYNRINNSIIDSFYKIAKQYNDSIYEMAYTFKHISNCIIAIKTRARLFYGDYNKYEQFKKEIYSIIYNDYNKIIEDINACKKENPNDFQDTWKFYNEPEVIIDGVDVDGGRFYSCFCLSSNYKYIKHPALKLYYNDIVFPKRSDKK